MAIVLVTAPMCGLAAVLSAYLQPQFPVVASWINANIEPEGESREKDTSNQRRLVVIFIFECVAI